MQTIRHQVQVRHTFSDISVIINGGVVDRARLNHAQDRPDMLIQAAEATANHLNTDVEHIHRPAAFEPSLPPV